MSYMVTQRARSHPTANTSWTSLGSRSGIFAQQPTTQVLNTATAADVTQDSVNTTTQSENRYTIMSGLQFAYDEKCKLRDENQEQNGDPALRPRSLMFVYEHHNAGMEQYAPMVVLDFRKHPEIPNNVTNMNISRFTYEQCYHLGACVAVFLKNAKIANSIAMEFAYDLVVGIVENLDEPAVTIYRTVPTYRPLEDLELQGVILNAEMQAILFPYCFKLHNSYAQKLDGILQHPDPELDSRSSLVETRESNHGSISDHDSSQGTTETPDVSAIPYESHHDLSHTDETQQVSTQDIGNSGQSELSEQDQQQQQHSGADLPTTTEASTIQEPQMTQDTTVEQPQVAETTTAQQPQVATQPARVDSARAARPNVGNFFRTTQTLGQQFMRNRGHNKTNNAASTPAPDSTPDIPSTQTPAGRPSYRPERGAPPHPP